MCTFVKRFARQIVLPAEGGDGGGGAVRVGGGGGDVRTSWVSPDVEGQERDAVCGKGVGAG